MGSLAAMELQSRKHVVVGSDEFVLRKKILESHAYDGSAFDTEYMVSTIEGVLKLAVDHQGRNDEKIIPTTGSDSVLDKLPYLLHQITCVLNCKCSGGDSHASALEILQLLANYSWEAKIAIVLAAFAVEYAQYNLVATLSNTNDLARIVAMLKLPDHSHKILVSKFQTIISLVNISIGVIRLITRFGSLPNKHISNDAEPMVAALDLIPLAVYWITRGVISCASEFAGILGYDEITSSYTETWNITSLKQKITTTLTTLETHLDRCNVFIEEKKYIRYVQKLKSMFSQRIVYIDNQKILQTLLVNKKGNPRPLSYGPEAELGVEALKGKTVLLYISSLQISKEEFEILAKWYTQSRREREKYKYEIVWLPIVEKKMSEEDIDKAYGEMKKHMPWYTLLKASMLKRGVAKFAREEWNFSKKSKMVVLDQRGRVVNNDAFHMVWTWGNQVYPFTERQELDHWKSEEWSKWSLKMLVDETKEYVPSLIKSGKIICLYGGDKLEWIQKLVTKTREIQKKARIEIEMVYISKTTNKESFTKITQNLGGGKYWDISASTHFWKRIEYMTYSKVQRGAKIPTAKEGGDPVLGELLNMLTLGDCEQGWALISQGDGFGEGKIARAKGDLIITALQEFESWSLEVEKKSFVVALHDYLAGRPAGDHHCNRLILPGIEDFPDMVVCSECGRPMEKFIMYRCCTDY